MQPTAPPSAGLLGPPAGGLGAAPYGAAGATDPAAADLEADALAALADAAAESGLDLYTLLSSTDPGAEPDATREGETAPGTGPSPGLSLADDEKKDLERELCDLVDRYQRATQPLVDQEQEIRDAYDMAADSSGPTAGTASGDSGLVSETLMVQVDQNTARLTTNITSVRPLIQVDPIAGTIFDSKEHADLAASSQAFLNEYVTNEMGFRYLLPAAIHRAVMVGTAVLRLQWAEEQRTTRYFTATSPREVADTYTVAGVKAQLIENRLAIVWPPTLLDWQRDYEIVGHETYHSLSSWKALSASWDLTEEVRAEVEAQPGERDEAGDRGNERRGIDSQQLDGQALLNPNGQVKLTELWCNLYLPSHKARVKFQVILHRPTQRILWVDYNRHQSQRHPYFPIRYKWSDVAAWGRGVGHESINCWAADTAMWQLSLDNIAAGAFYIIVRDSAAVHRTQRQPIRPGSEVVTDRPETDLLPRKMGGDAPELIEARRENKARMKEATGTPDVAMGMGDETMKSGAGTGSTLALIEQAGMKVRLVDHTMREDLSPIFSFALELVAQFGTEGVFYNHVGAEDSSRLSRLRYVPPRGADIASLFRIRAMAPNAATSTEARRNNLLVIWGFAQEAVKVMNEFVAPLIQQENPAGLIRWQRAMADTLHEIMRRVFELHEVPGVLGLMPPSLPEATPEDVQINQLNAELQQAYAALEQLQAQAQQLVGGQQPPVAGADGGGDPTAATAVAPTNGAGPPVSAAPPAVPYPGAN